MKKTMILAISSVVALGLSSCSTNNSMDSSSVCSNNPFLQQYNCSLTAVQQAAEKGQPDAQYALGYMYYYGIGTAKDQQKAMLWIRRAANQGQPLAIKAVQMLNKSDYPTMGSASLKESAHSVYAKPRVKHAHHINLAKVKRASVVTSGYAIQVMGGRSSDAVHAFMDRHNLYQKAKVYDTSYNGRPWYIVIYGRYNTYLEAKEALANLPTELKKNRPWILSAKSIRAELKYGIK